MVAHCEDSDLIAYLEELGIDSHTPRTLNVCLVISDHALANETSKRLQALGYCTVVDEVPAPVLLRWIVKPEWHLTGTRVSPTDLATMTEIRQALGGLAAQHGGVYDGWYVDIDDTEPTSAEAPSA